MSRFEDTHGTSTPPVSRWPAWLVLALGLVATLGATVAIWQSELDRARETFNREANEGALALQRELQLVLAQVNGLGYYFAANDAEPARFRELANAVTSGQPAIRGLAWLSDDLESCWLSAELRSRQFCARWRVQIPAIDEAARLVAETGTAELLGHPSADGAMVVQLAPAGKGVIAGLVDLTAIMQQASKNRLFPEMIIVRVLDRPDQGSATTVFELAPHETPAHRYRYVRTLAAGPGRQLMIEAIPTVRYLRSSISATPWVVGASGVFISLLGFLYVRRLLQYTADVEAQVRERTQQLDAANRQLTILARLDPVTGLRNRRAFFEDAENILKRTEERSEGLLLLMVDIDHFKQYNDHFGHRAGDHCLQRVAAAIASCCRGEDDLVARYGGEEFIVLIPCGAAAAEEIAERIRDTVARMAIPHVAGTAAGVVTISVGACIVPRARGGEAMAEWIEIADQALYAAKEAGRNRVVSAVALSRGGGTAEVVSL